MGVRVIGVVCVVFLTVLPCVMGCGPDGGNSATRSRVALLKGETLRAGGLGPLAVGETTLGEALERYGSGVSSTLAGDEFVAVELAFADGGLRLFFSIDRSKGARSPLLRTGLRSLAAAVRTDPAELGQTHPELFALPLHSIAVQAPFFTGSTELGVRLGDDLREVRRLHERSPNGGP